MCRVMGCQRVASVGTYFCDPHGDLWLGSPEQERVAAAYDRTSDKLLDYPHHVRDTAIADFARRIGAEALNGAK